MSYCALHPSVEEGALQLGYAIFNEDFLFEDIGVFKTPSAKEFHEFVSREDLTFFAYDSCEMALMLEEDASKANVLVPDFLCYDVICLIFSRCGKGKGMSLPEMYFSLVGEDLGDDLPPAQKAKALGILIREGFSYFHRSLDELNLNPFRDCNCYMHGCLNAILSKRQFDKNIEDVYSNLESLGIERLVFFDLECANCFDGVGKICEFGAVTTDLEFNVLKRDFMLINPEDRFALAGRNGSPDLKLAYPEKTYFNSPKLAYYESQIRSIMQSKGTMVAGFAIGNDVSFLATDLNSYDLPQIEYPCFDVQEWVSPPDHSISLEKAYAEVVPTEEKRPFREHRSVDDAEMTMLVAKFYLQSSGKTLTELLKEHPKSIYTSQGFLDLWLSEPDLPKGKRPRLIERFPYHKQSDQ